MARPLPGLVEVARSAEKSVAFFYNWEQLRDVARPGYINFSYFRDSWRDRDGDRNGHRGEPFDTGDSKIAGA